MEGERGGRRDSFYLLAPGETRPPSDSRARKRPPLGWVDPFLGSVAPTSTRALGGTDRPPTPVAADTLPSVRPSVLPSFLPSFLALSALPFLKLPSAVSLCFCQSTRGTRLKGNAKKNIVDITDLWTLSRCKSHERVRLRKNNSQIKGLEYYNKKYKNVRRKLQV